GSDRIMQRMQNRSSGKHPERNCVTSHVEVDNVERASPLQRTGDVTAFVICVFPDAVSVHRFYQVAFAEGLDFRDRGGIARGKDCNFVAPLDESLRKQIHDIFDPSLRRGGHAGPQRRNQGDPQAPKCVLRSHVATDPRLELAEKPRTAVNGHSSIPISISADLTRASHKTFISCARSRPYVVSASSPVPG